MTTRRRHGVAAIEFALTLPILLLIVVGLVEGSLAIHRAHLVARIARDSCRVGSMVMEGQDPTGVDIEAAAIAHANFALQAASLWCGENGGCDVQAEWAPNGEWHVLYVSVRVPYQGIFGSLPLVPHYTFAEFTSYTQQQRYDTDPRP